MDITEQHWQAYSLRTQDGLSRLATAEEMGVPEYIVARLIADMRTWQPNLFTPIETEVQNAWHQLGGQSAVKIVSYGPSLDNKVKPPAGSKGTCTDPAKIYQAKADKQCPDCGLHRRERHSFEFQMCSEGMYCQRCEWSA